MPAKPHSPLSQRVLQAIQQHQLCRPHDCLIVGVSGGADSVALLDLLSQLPGLPLQLVVAHVNHCLRGRESDADEAFVQELASAYGLACEVTRVAVQEQAAQQHCSLEEAGREARYAFFEALRQRHQAAAVAVAHHADDQAETLLLRLLRGAGSSGLSAMAPRTGAGIIRPLLGCTRQELRDYLAARQLTFREDSSNAKQDVLRNRIRHELLPLLQTYNPAIAERLAATAQLLGEEQQVVNHYTTGCFLELARCGNGWVALPKARLTDLLRGLRLQLYRQAVQHILGTLRRFELKHFDLLDQAVIYAATGSRLNLPQGLAALVTAEQLLLARKELLHPAPPACCCITAPGSYDLGNGLSLLVEPAPAPANWHDLPASVTYVDSAAAPFPWLVRPIAPGDRLELLGMTGSRSVQDILTDLKLPRHLRRALPLLCQNGQPLWLAGVRRTRHALLQAGQPTGLRITLSGQEQLPLFP